MGEKQQSKLKATLDALRRLDKQISELHALVAELATEEFNAGACQAEQLWQEKARQEYQRGKRDGIFVGF